MTAIYLFALLQGIAAWLPAPTPARRDWQGYLFLQSWLLLIVFLYVGDVLLGVALSHLWIASVAVAVLGVAWRAYRQRGRFSALPAFLVHPIWILLGLVCALAVANGGVEYLPFPGDETASWLRQARQIFLIDAYWSDRMVYHLGAYTNGWPLLIAFSNTIHGVYDDAHGVAVGFVMQLGLIGAAFDLVRFIIRREAPAIENRSAALVAWLVVLALLAVEASWVLLPIFQLIDEPLVFALIGCFLTAIPGFYEGTNRSVGAAYLGIGFAASYLLKIAALTFAPAVAVLALGLVYFDRRDNSGLRPAGRMMPISRQIAGYASVVFLPFLIAVVSWAHFKTGTDCNASPIDLLTKEIGPAFRQPLAVAVGFAANFADFFLAYKVPLSVLAVVSLAGGLLHGRARWVTIAFVGFTLAYTFALYFAYLTCLDAINYGRFEALQRYLRTVARLLHFLGPIVLVMALAHLARTNALIARIARRRLTQGTAVLVIVLLFAWQARSVDRSLDDMRTRAYQSPALKSAILGIKADAASLIDLVTQRGLVQPRVSLVTQGGYGVEYDLAQYFGIKTRADGASNFFYIPERPWSWNSDANKAFSAATTPDELEQFWRGFDIVWPYHTDPGTRAILARLVADKSCQDEPEQFFFVRSHDGSFECIAKVR